MKFLDKPEYLLRPQQVIARLRFALLKKGGFVDVGLPWGLTVRVKPTDVIGRSICTYGLYDLVTTESIARLLAPGETAVDVGANIGYMTGVMAWRAGSEGQVICFEPCEEIFSDLAANLHLWKDNDKLAPIQARQVALSRVDGHGALYIPADFGGNRGIASLESRDFTSSTQVQSVKVSRLDEILGHIRRIDLMKIDVEGHELGVLEGAQALLASHRVRDIVFEDYGEYPTPVQLLLKSYGYTLYRLSRNFSRPLLLPGDDSRRWDQHPVGVLSNYLATLDSSRVRARFASAGWYVLSSRDGKRQRSNH